jgi:hypothetical protein
MKVHSTQIGQTKNNKGEQMNIFSKKHKFDLDNPNTAECCGFRFPQYICKKCGKTLCLDSWQMKQLPWSISHGCTGKKDNK